MSKEIEFVEELFDELHELASWEGCETGDLCNNLMDLWEGSISYASLEFQRALEKEIRSLYDCLKEEKMGEDINMVETIAPLSTKEMRELALAKLTDEEKKILGV